MSLCIITGAGAGIGKATAIELSKQSFFDSYAILGRNADALAQTVNEMLSNNPALKIKTYSIDLTDPDKIPDIIDGVYADFGRVD